MLLIAHQQGMKATASLVEVIVARLRMMTGMGQ
jgi:hypothetical protein